MKLKGIMAAAVTVAMVSSCNSYTDDDCTGTDFTVKYDSVCRTDE